MSQQSESIELVLTGHSCIMRTRKNIFSGILLALIRRIRHLIVLAKATKMSENAIRNSRTKNLLVLCYGNIYRSPLVEYLLRKTVKTSKVDIRSAGFHEKEHRSCDPEYLKLLSMRGYTLQAHRSSRVSKQDIEWADLIVIMDRKNWDMLLGLDNTVKSKVVWIGAFTENVKNEIADPYGMHQGDVNKIIDQIELSVADLANRIDDNNTLSKTVKK